jgi:hypothetical protein
MEGTEEIHQGGGPRTRPESSTSSRGRYTPQSSTSSCANSQNRVNTSGRERERERAQDREVERRDVSAQGSLLQERLREKKAARLSERRRSVDVDMPLVDDRIVSASSPIRNGSGIARQSREARPSSSGGRAAGKKGMGVKEMEEVCRILPEFV